MNKKFEDALGGLAGWFERRQRVLPWRENPDVYRVWISEIMLQQTQVVTVVPYFEKFMRRFPSVDALAGAPLEDVLFHWAGLGYYSRARNLHRAACMIREAGGFPRTREEWLKIPGVGEYTAGAILSIALNEPEAILDGNVERVLSRLHRVSREEGDSAYKRRLWSHSVEAVTGALSSGIAPRITNQALMELGATVCTPKGPKCGVCPLEGICGARQHGEQESFPPKKKPKEWLDISEKTHCCIDSHGRVLVRLRQSGEWRAGLWDLLTETPQEILRATKFQFLGEVRSRHVVTRHRITRTTQVWRAQAEQGMGVSEAEFENLRPSLQWIVPEKSEVALGSALKKTLIQVRETYPEAWPAS